MHIINNAERSIYVNTVITMHILATTCVAMISVMSPISNVVMLSRMTQSSIKRPKNMFFYYIHSNQILIDLK